MLQPAAFYRTLVEQGIANFTGVPDSLLKDFCAYVTDHATPSSNIIAANEGNAVAIAAGRYLATQQISLVYMQNSGLGNIINPVTSLIDPLVYSIPLLLLVGWRGQPGLKDEPQHAKQGQITLAQLEVLGIKYAILPAADTEAQAVLQEASIYMTTNQAPFALVVEKGTFAPYRLQSEQPTSFPLNREEALQTVISQLTAHDVVVSTTGKTSRELYEYRQALGHDHEHDFLTVGSMGHASQIALGIALAKPQTNVYCLDGDGALLMHLGGLAIIGSTAPTNLKHIILNNGAHDSVGGQPTVGQQIDIPAIAQACGYQTVRQAQSKKEISDQLAVLQESPGPALLEIKINKGARADLGRPQSTPLENKAAFMKFLRSCR
ncbi:MAG TPA: phosphonopyruvate decarboxylase [Oscillospiraceae bacterium]|nr:phosphonopyruvate decarboxylase [Oscillospiraceae bacterium]